MTLRSVRNNNPGNIDRGHFNWQGQMPEAQMTPEQKIEPRFVVFENPGWGFRAMCIELLNYQRFDGCDTITKVISRWAPPGENNTAAYIKDVAAKAGLDATATLALTDVGPLTAVAKAIASHEAAGSLPYDQSFDPFWKEADLVWGVQSALQG